MPLEPLPPRVAWRHLGVRDGCEVAFVTTGQPGRGWTTIEGSVLDYPGPAARLRV